MGPGRRICPRVSTSRIIAAPVLGFHSPRHHLAAWNLLTDYHMLVPQVKEVVNVGDGRIRVLPLAPHNHRSLTPASYLKTIVLAGLRERGFDGHFSF